MASISWGSEVQSSLTIVILAISAGPLSIFLRRLQETKRRGMFEYGALAGFLGTQFENKWLPDRGNLEPDSLESTNFSATTEGIIDEHLEGSVLRIT